MSTVVYDFKAAGIDGKQIDLKKFKGKVLLIVNTASQCGFTPQYKGLEEVYERYRSHGFEVLGFPANNFLSQEPGSEEEIRSFCSTNYGVQFPLFSKISVKGDDKHLLYKKLTAAHSTADISNGPQFEEKLAGFGQKRDVPEDILWNFEKFIIGKDGNVIARVAPDVPADDLRVVSKIESALSA